MRLKEVKELIPNSKIFGSENVQIKSLAYDSREVEKGALFTAIRGYRFDGHDYISEAREKGAKALIVEEKGDYNLPYLLVEDSRFVLAKVSAAFYGYPGRKMTLIGVTGTNGKTTTSFLIEGILNCAGKKAGLLGTVTYRYKDRTFPGERTTPESLDLQKQLAELVSIGAKSVVMEVSSHALKLKRVGGLEFDIGVFTNLTPEHGEFHPSQADYLESKALLFNKYLKETGQGVINADTDQAPFLLSQNRGNSLTYSLQGRGDLNGEILETGPEGLVLRIFWGQEQKDIGLNLAGTFNAYNALAAIGTGLALGLDLEKISRGIKQVKGVPGRFELVGRGEEIGVIVDFAHTPDSLANVLKTARDIAPKNLILVFGCGGDRDREKRPEMTRIAVELADYVIITADNPRNEDLSQIIEDMKTGLGREKNMEIIPDREKAIFKGIEVAGKGDLVLIAGKGHETGQEIRGEVFPFDDREVAKRALARKKRGAENGKDEC